MSLVTMFCKDCENDAQTLADGSNPGFNIDVPSTIIFGTISYEKNTGEVLGNEASGNLMQEMMSQAERGGISCGNCGSHDIDVKIGPDMIQERNEELLIETIDTDEIAEDLQLGRDFHIPVLNNNNKIASERQTLVIPKFEMPVVGGGK